MAVIYGYTSKHLLLGKTFFLVSSLTWLVFSVSVFLISKNLFDNNQSLTRLVVLILCFGPIYLILQFLINKDIIDLKKYFSGLVGEDLVLGVLRKLPDNYLVFHGIKVPGHWGDIDFVVVGPTGVFSVEVKNHKGVIGFDGQELTLSHSRIREKDIIKQAKREALDLNNFLLATTGTNEFVNPTLVFSNPSTKLNLRSNLVNKVKVLHTSDLIKTLTDNPTVKINDRIVDVLKSLI